MNCDDSCVTKPMLLLQFLEVLENGSKFLHKSFHPMDYNILKSRTNLELYNNAKHVTEQKRAAGQIPLQTASNWNHGDR